MASYLTVLIIGIMVTLVVGQLLLREGRHFLGEVFDNRELATSTNHLLATLYHLVALGLLGLLSTADPVIEGLTGVQTVITRVGVILLTLGGVYGLTMLALAGARRRRQTHAFEEGMAAQYHQHRH